MPEKAFCFATLAHLSTSNLGFYFYFFRRSGETEPKLKDRQETVCFCGSGETKADLLLECPWPKQHVFVTSKVSVVHLGSNFFKKTYPTSLKVIRLKNTLITFKETKKTTTEWPNYSGEILPCINKTITIFNFFLVHFILSFYCTKVRQCWKWGLKRRARHNLKLGPPQENNHVTTHCFLSGVRTFCHVSVMSVDDRQSHGGPEQCKMSCDVCLKGLNLDSAASWIISEWAAGLHMWGKTCSQCLGA